MSQNNDKFDIPNNSSNTPPVVPGQKFDPHSIPKFKNPNTSEDNGTARAGHESRSVVASVNLDTRKTPKNVNIDKKQKAQKKLTKLRKHRHFATLRFAIVSFIVFLLLFNSQLIYSQALYLFANRSASNNTQSTVPATPVSAPTQTAEVVGPENVLIIPKINVNAPLVFIDTTEERAVLKALQDGVVHYSGTALPGDNGNAVFFGHSSNDVWEKGNYKFVFVLLEKLTVGDTYEIHYQSRKYVYRVESTSVVVPTDLSVLNQTTTPYSTLITCTPPGTSWKRFVVKAKQISPEPSQTVQTANQSQQPLNVSSQTSVLPSAAPNLIEQIQMFFSNLLATVAGQPNQSKPESQPNNNPSNNRLPEVSFSKETQSMPTTF